MKVIGAGFGRTGTLSLKTALERLDLGPCHHMVEVLGRPDDADLWHDALDGRPDWPALLTGYQAAVDWPSVCFWRELCDLHRDAKVVLTVRDPDRWYDSVRNTFLTVAPDLLASAPPSVRRLTRRVLEREFDGLPEDRAAAIARFERHNAEVRAAIDPGRLLIFEPAQGWRPLCAFLGAPVPDEPFPHLNDTASFPRSVAEHLAGG
ncbi:sulfotransferase family protein [Nocardiopsis trehalosi]|jgi:hypothetical protein|uniref:sulfotransferase family protein n=1 Tax=Nocardiopsis trehalosi TaxID=109329 RepID=UPI0008302678|nr:sulfotransferase family protein [Nocardiopsis trehalosi]